MVGEAEEGIPVAARPYIARVGGRSQRRRMRGQTQQSILSRLFEQAFGSRGGNDPARRIQIRIIDNVKAFIVRSGGDQEESSSSDDVTPISIHLIGSSNS